MKTEGNIQGKLLSGLFWVLLANLLVKPFWILGVEVGVQNAVGNEAYGFYYALFSFSYIFNILLDLGVTNFNTRNIAQHPQLISKHLSGILGIKVMLFALYLVVTFSVGLLMGYGSGEFRLLALLTDEEQKVLDYTLISPRPEAVFDLAAEFNCETTRIYRIRACAVSKLVRLRYGAGE